MFFFTLTKLNPVTFFFAWYFIAFANFYVAMFKRNACHIFKRLTGEKVILWAITLLIMLASLPSYKSQKNSALLCLSPGIRSSIPSCCLAKTNNKGEDRLILTREDCQIGSLVTSINVSLVFFSMDMCKKDCFYHIQELEIKFLYFCFTSCKSQNTNSQNHFIHDQRGVKRSTC